MPFSWFEPMWLENLGFAEPGEGWKLTEAGETAIDGDLPVNPSGGVLSLQPDRRLRAAPVRRGGAAGAWARPGSTRSTGPRNALGHAYGGGSQFFSMWVVAATP